MKEVRKYGSGGFRIRGYVGEIEKLATDLGVNLSEARAVRLTVLELFLREEEEGYIMGEMEGRGYLGSVIRREYDRCNYIARDVKRLVDMRVLPKTRAVEELRNRVMSVGGGVGEISKDEIVAILSGLALDSRTDVLEKLKAIEILGKYRNYYTDVDKEIRVIVESGRSSDSEPFIGDPPDGMDVYKEGRGGDTGLNQA